MLDWGLDTPFMSQDRPPLAIAMTATVDGTRGLRRYRLVIAQKAKLRLSPEVATALASKAADHRLTASGFFPCSIDREFLYGYAADGYRSPLWICAAYDGEPVLVHRQRGTVLYFHQAISEKKILAIPGIHYFDAHRLDALLLDAPELQHTVPTAGPAGRHQPAMTGCEIGLREKFGYKQITMCFSFFFLGKYDFIGCFLACL